MLVLSRKPGEKLVVGKGITVTVVEVNGSRVRVGIEAPDDLRILRAELACWQTEAVDIEEEYLGRCVSHPVEEVPYDNDNETRLRPDNV